MEKTGITIISNFGLDPVIAVSIIATGILNACEIKADNLGLKIEYVQIDTMSPELAVYYIPAVYILEDLEGKLGSEELLIVVGYPETHNLEKLLSKISQRMNVILIGNQCSAYLASTILNIPPEADYLQAAMMWCELQGMKLKESVLEACAGNENIGRNIYYRYETAWKVNFNLDVTNLNNQAYFHSEFANELTHGCISKYIEGLLSLKKEMEKETDLLLQDLQDLGQGIGIIRTGSKPFFKVDALKRITDAYLVGIIEYVQDNKKEYIIIYRNQLNFKTTDVKIIEGGIIPRPLGQN